MADALEVRSCPARLESFRRKTDAESGFALGRRLLALAFFPMEFAIGAFGLTGWWLAIPAVDGVFSRLSLMKPDNAVGSILAAAATFFCFFGLGPKVLWKATASVLSAGGALIEFSALVKYRTHSNFSRDSLPFDSGVEARKRLRLSNAVAIVTLATGLVGLAHLTHLRGMPATTDGF
jgi:hypothetical protein